jgi:hypothetical protein
MLTHGFAGQSLFDNSEKLAWGTRYDAPRPSAKHNASLDSAGHIAATTEAFCLRTTARFDQNGPNFVHAKLRATLVLPSADARARDKNGEFCPRKSCLDECREWSFFKLLRGNNLRPRGVRCAMDIMDINAQNRTNEWRHIVVALGTMTAVATMTASESG